MESRFWFDTVFLFHVSFTSAFIIYASVCLWVFVCAHLKRNRQGRKWIERERKTDTHTHTHTMESRVLYSCSAWQRNSDTIMKIDTSVTLGTTERGIQQSYIRQSTTLTPHNFKEKKNKNKSFGDKKMIPVWGLYLTFLPSLPRCFATLCKLPLAPNKPCRKISGLLETSSESASCGYSA